MAFLYILLSSKDHRFYFGVSEDVASRLHQHNAGRVRATKGRRPLALIHVREFSSISAARYTEWKLKNSAHFRKKYLQENDISVGAW